MIYGLNLYCKNKIDEESVIYIEGWYNRKRLYSSINYMTPDQCESLVRSVS